MGSEKLIVKDGGGQLFDKRDTPKEELTNFKLVEKDKTWLEYQEWLYLENLKRDYNEEY